MGADVKYQLRLVLAPAFARAAREEPYSETLSPLVDVLKKHNATLTCQYDEFARHVAACEAHGDPDTKLAKWTRDVLAKPDKVDYFKTVFTVAVRGEQLFDRATLDALRDDAAGLIDRGVVAKMYDTTNDPARNPQIPRRFQQ